MWSSFQAAQMESSEADWFVLPSCSEDAFQLLGLVLVWAMTRRSNSDTGAPNQFSGVEFGFGKEARIGRAPIATCILSRERKKTCIYQL